MATCLEELPELGRGGVDEDVIRDVGGAIYLGEYYCYVNHRRVAFNSELAVCPGGEETVGDPGGLRFLTDCSVSKTAAAIMSFFLAATLHPEVVRLAQEELDRVIGGDRLPEFSDKPQLPYISAIVKEVLRWGIPVPLGTVFL